MFPRLAPRASSSIEWLGGFEGEYRLSPAMAGMESGGVDCHGRSDAGTLCRGNGPVKMLTLWVPARLLDGPSQPRFVLCDYPDLAAGGCFQGHLIDLELPSLTVSDVRSRCGGR